MALQVFPGGLWSAPPFAGTAPTIISSLIDASTEKTAFAFQVPKTGTLDKVEFRVGPVTFNASSILRVSFQDLAAGGSPDGTQDQYRDMNTGITSNSWQVPGLMTSDGTDTGVKRSVTRGQFLAVVFEYQAFVSANGINITGLTRPPASGLPWCQLNTGTWAVINNFGPSIALKYDDGTYPFMPGCYPVLTITLTQPTSATTPDERGLYFQVPMPTTLEGIYIHFDAGGAGRDFDIVVYQQGNNTPLATLSVDADYAAAFAARGYQYWFASAISLAKQTNYRIVVKPTTTGQGALYEYDVSAAALMDGFEGGQLWHHTQRTDGATTGGTLGDGWTQTTTKRPFLSPLFGQFDDGVGGAGGGLIVHPGMSGGMRG